MKIGTRSSTMAMAQTNEIAAQLRRAIPGIEPEIIQFKPRGDVDQTSKLDQHGGKGGAFVSEIRDAMRSGTLDAAMHSLKDVPGDEEAPGLVFAAYLKREAVEDALVLHPDLSLETLEARGGEGLKLGTNSVRRAAFLSELYPQAEIIHYRGAADTRIAKLDARQLQNLPGGGQVGPADALVMAKSGLGRVGLADRIVKTYPPTQMLPAVGQGIVVVECAARDWKTREMLALIDDADARMAAMAEREMLWILNGHCNAPIAGLAMRNGDQLTLRAAVLSLDGKTIIRGERTGPAEKPRELGRSVGLSLLAEGADALIAGSAPDGTLGAV